MEGFKKIISLVRWPFVGMVWCYQKTFSPDHGFVKYLFPHGYCKFYPSCSEYTRQSIQEQGVVKGIIKGVWRIMRCNPWSKGGIDLP